MITVAVATRTMDRQKRYRTLLPEENFTLIAALDCKMLAVMVSKRPVDVILFDIQHPAMPATEWLDMLEENPELKAIPIVWVGHSVLPSVLERIGGLAGSKIIPPRPSEDVLMQEVQKANQKRKEATDPGKPLPSPRDADWQPEEDVIDEALSIFDMSDDEDTLKTTAGGVFTADEFQSGTDRKKAAASERPKIDDITERGKLISDSDKVPVEPPAPKPAAKKPEQAFDPGNIPADAVDKIMIGGEGEPPSQVSMPDADQIDSLISRIAEEVVNELADRVVKQIRSELAGQKLHQLIEKKLSFLKAHSL